MAFLFAEEGCFNIKKELTCNCYLLDSDENLQTDHYLISQMDAEGWVPISTIADFKRVISVRLYSHLFT